MYLFLEVYRDMVHGTCVHYTWAMAEKKIEHMQYALLVADVPLIFTWRHVYMCIVSCATNLEIE